MLSASAVPPKCLHLEITEGSIMKDTAAAIDMLKLIRKIGVKLDVDDFGTGYSSLACLRQFPIDVIKIDQSFIAGLAHGAIRWRSFKPWCNWHETCASQSSRRGSRPRSRR